MVVSQDHLTLVLLSSTKKDKKKIKDKIFIFFGGEDYVRIY